MIIAVPPVQAEDMTVALLSPSATLESEVGSTVTYQVEQEMDSNNIVFQWNFGNGIDTYWNTNIGLVTLAEAGGSSVVLDSSDFTYTKADSPVKLRQMELNLKSKALEPGKDYTVTLGAAIAANNGTDTLGKDYVWQFSTADEDTIEITAFDAITDVNAGSAGEATYSDAASVQAVLPAEVTANVGTVTVPVTAWEDTDSYNSNEAGSYTFTAVLGTIPEGYANTGGYTATVEVVVTASEADTTAPVITLTGNATIDLTVGDTFSEPGYTANDNVDGDITGNVNVGGDTVDTNTAGTYIITYNVTDEAGNPADEVTRTVNVTALTDTTKPVINLTGNATMDLKVGDAFSEPGYTANDNVDGDITGNVIIGGDTVDTNTVGTYVITYNVSDEAGNPADEVIRTVNVASPVPPLSIRSAAELMAFAAAVNGGYTYEGETVTLTADIDLTTDTWATITGSFDGTFNGNGKTISNPDATLFKTIGTTGIVQKLGITGVEGHSVAVAPFAATNNGVIENCFNTINVTGNCGGIVDYNLGTIRYCYNTGSISGTWAGGIAERNRGSILNCYNAGSVTGTNWSGGIAGWSEATTAVVQYSYNIGDLSASRADRTGSIIGRINSGTALDCYYNSSNAATMQGSVGVNVSSKTDAEMQTADFVALLNGEQETAPWVQDTTAINGGFPIFTWQAPEDTEELPEADEYIGSAAELMAFAAAVNGGYTYEGETVTLTADIDLTTDTWATITGSFDGTFNGNGKTISNPDATLFKTIGTTGIVQKLGITGVEGHSVAVAPFAATNNGVIENCFNTINVTGNCGGIVDYNLGTIRYCYNTGSISGTWAGGIAERNRGSILNCYNAGSVTGTNWSGGIAGWSEATTAVVQYSYNIGDLSASRADRTGSIIGRINSGTALDCYYNSSNAATMQGSVGVNVSSKTDAEMQTADFVALLNGEQETAPWVQDTTAINGGFPIFTWQASGGSGGGGDDPSDPEDPTWPDGAAITPSDITISGFTVSYPAAEDNVGVTRYKIEVSSGIDILKSGYAVGLTKAFTGLDDNTTYTCTVMAEDAAGNQSSALTTDIKTLFNDVDAPSWSSGVKILVSDITKTGFTVCYPAASDNVGVVKYNVTLKIGSDVVSSVSITDLSKVFTELVEATEYTVSVDAEDADGNKSAALSTNVSTLQGIPTWGADAKLTISNVMATDVTINWPYSNTPKNVEGYVLYVNGSETERFLSSDYYCELGGLLSSTRYLFELKPYNEQGEFGEAISATAVTDGAAILSFTTTFAKEETAGEEYYKNYVLKYPVDLENFIMGWNFSNGIDKSLEANLAGIRIYEKDTGTEIVLDKGTAPYESDTEGALLAGDFRYTKSGGGDQGTGTETKTRLLIFEPSEATLAQFTLGKEYVLEMQPDFISNNGENTLSKITTFTFYIAPEDNEAPTWPDGAELAAVKTGPESIVVNWPDATDNLILKEYQLTVNGTEATVIDAEAATTCKLTGLTPDTVYDISVVAVDAKNNKSVALEISTRTLLEDKIVPTWPDGSSLTVKNIATDNADLLWTAADDNVEVTGYKVYNGDVLLADTNALQLHITGLIPATTYVFRIEAVDVYGNISSTGPVRVISTLEGLADTEAPQWNGGGGHSYSLTFDYSMTYVTLQWPWATDNVAVREYQVNLEGELIATVSNIANSYSGTLPLDGSYHNYEVYAIDAAGNISAQPQSFSVLAGQLPDDLIAPYWPAGNEIIISDFTDKTAVFSWSAAMDNKEVVAYLLKRGQLWVVWLSNNENYPGYMSFEDRKIWYDLDKLYPLGLTYNHPRALINLVEGEPFSCSLKAFDALGNSSIGGPNITFYPGTNPTAGSGIAFALSNVENSRGTLSSLTGAMNLVDNPTDPELTSFVFDFDCQLPADYADGITLYNKTANELVTLAPENFVYAEDGETSKLTINTGILNAEATYVIKFSKDYSSSTGAAIGFDLAWEFTTAAADKEIPTWRTGAEMGVAFNVSPVAADLTWPEAVDNQQVTKYKVIKGDEVLAVLPGDTREYLAEDLSVATEYTFKVQAGDYLGNWSSLLEKTVTTPAADNTPPGWGTAALTFTDVHSDNVTLNWDPASGDYAVKEYLIYKNEDSDPLTVLNSDILTWLAGGLTGETSYTFKVYARDYSGNLSAALNNNVTTAVDDVKPTWPANAFLNAKDLKSDGFTLYWQAALDNVKIGKYNIYQDGSLLGETASGDITEYEITGLEATTKYTFMVEAVDTNGNITAEKLIFEQSTTVSGPTEGAGIEFTMIDPANENVGTSGNVMINRVTEPLLDTDVCFAFNFAKDLADDTWLNNIELIKNEDAENPIELEAEYFTYSFTDETAELKIEIPQELVDMGASYQLILKASLAAKDESTLDKDFIWQFNVAEGLYGIKDIAVGMNNYSAFYTAADRFYLMLKTDGTVWTWGNNLYGHLGDGTFQNSAVPVQALNLQNIVKVIAGENSAFAIDADGGVWAWGSNEYGQLGQGILPSGTSGRTLPENAYPRKITGLPPIVKLAYGFNRVIALDVNGDVWTWGFRTSVRAPYYGVLSTGTPAKVPSLSNITDVAIGWQDSMAVTADGKALYWSGIEDSPAEVAGLTDVKAVACLETNYVKHHLVMKKDGTVWYWGQGTIVTVLDPNNFQNNQLVVDLIQVKSSEPIKEIFSNSLSVMTNDRSIRNIDIDFAVKSAVVGSVLANLTDISKLAVYTPPSHTVLSALDPPGGLALKLDGTLLQFIDNTVTPIKLGMETVEPPVWPDESAITVSNLAEKGLTISWNSCGEDVAAYALYQDGSLVKTLPGSNLSHSITGLAKDTAYTFKVEARLAGSSFTTNGPSKSVTLTEWNPTMQGTGKLAAGTGHTLMIDADGNVWAWGSNEYGQLGIGSYEDQITPNKIDGLNDIIAVAAGDNHSIALDGDGNVWTWGKNNVYQLGLGTVENSSVPIKLTTINGVNGISAAGNYNLAVKTDGTLWSWGEACNANLNYAISGIDGQTPGRMKYGTVSPAINYYYENIKSAAASRNFYAVLFADGTISRSGSFIDNVGAGTYWTMLYNPGLMGVQAISAGNDFLMALLEDGTVAVLGDNSQGQSGSGSRTNPTPAAPAAYKMVAGLDEVVAISAGGAHGLALRADGSAWGWGQNDNGQIGNGNTITQLVPAATARVSGISAIDAGNLYSVVLKNDVSANIEAYAFGDNDQGQLGTGNTVASTVAKRIIFPGFVDTAEPIFPDWFAINVTWSDNQAVLRWSDAEDDVGVTAYEIWQNSVKINEVTGDKLSYTAADLVSGQNYEFGIKARDAAGNLSVLSKTVNNSDVTAPEWIDATLTASNITKSSLTLTWSGAADNVGVTTYNVYSGTTLLKAVTTTTCNLTGLSSGTTYTFKVEAGDKAGNLSTTGPSTTANTLTSTSGGGSGTPGDGSGSGTGSEGDLTVSFIDVKLSPTDTVLHLDFSNGMDENLDASLALISVYEKSTKKEVKYSEYKYIKSGSTDTGNKIRRIELYFDNLKAGTTYVIKLGKDMMANNGGTLGIDTCFEFTTTGSASSSGATTGIDSQGGTVTGSGMILTIPALALANSAQITLETAGDISGMPLNENSLLIGSVVTVTSDKDTDFLEPVVMMMEFDKSKVDLDKYDLGLYRFDEETGKWIELDNLVIDLNGETISGETTQLGNYAVIATPKVTDDLPATPVPEPAVQLSDIQNHWAKENIEQLVAMGAISGYPDGTFAPDKGISRAEFAVVLVKAFKLEALEGKIFADTNEHWAQDSISAAYANGIISGYDDSTFGPDDIITREQMAVMIVKAAKLTTGTAKVDFADAGMISSWAAEAIAAAYNNQLISGYPDNTFRPDQGASRAEAVTAILSALKIAQQ